MEDNSRRKFLREISLTLGAIAFGKEIADAGPLFQKKDTLTRRRGGILKDVVDFRYSPASWQTTYCFPDDPHKSLIGKGGELLYGHRGKDAPYDEFARVVSVDLKDKEKRQWLSQSFDSPDVPIITTRYAWEDATMELTSFASNDPAEGRVDNLLIVLQANGTGNVRLTPEIRVRSGTGFDTENRPEATSRHKETGIVSFESGNKELFFIVDSAVDDDDDGEMHYFTLKGVDAKEGASEIYFVRFPQEGQAVDLLAKHLNSHEKLLADARDFWRAWEATDGKVSWNLWGAYQQFLTASARNIVQSREVKNGKPAMQVGPTVRPGLRVVDGHFMSEAARYLGRDNDADATLRSIWDLQDDTGAITASAGGTNYKDTAVAIYSLVRHAELTQNYDLLNELYPDAYKAMVYLRALRDSAISENTLNGKYRLVAGGFGDSGLRGEHSAEITSSLWTLLALKNLLEVSDRLSLYKASEIREFYGQQRASFIAMTRKEMVQHPSGFRYLPMLLKGDPLWSNPDQTLRPKPQTAQINMSHAIYPGMLFLLDDGIVKGHLELMKTVMQEEVPIETGWLNDRSAWTTNAAVAAQAFLFGGQSDIARKMFIGFLNHASPLLSWREEQPLKNSNLSKYAGDMPHNWASAECIRYLRHSLVLEDNKTLRLLEGVGEDDLADRRPMSLVSTPTRWGRVTLSHEPIDSKRWLTKFKREDFDERTMPPLASIEMPRRLPGRLHFDKATGTSAIKNGPRVIIDGKATMWEATWINPYIK